MSAHYGHHVGEDEDGETLYLAGHVEKRRALAAANRYARIEQGLVNLYDAHGVTLDGFLRVDHVWWRQDPDDAERMQVCGPNDDGAEPWTEVTL